MNLLNIFTALTVFVILSAQPCWSADLVACPPSFSCIRSLIDFVTKPTNQDEGDNNQGEIIKLGEPLLPIILKTKFPSGKRGFLSPSKLNQIFNLDKDTSLEFVRELSSWIIPMDSINWYAKVDVMKYHRALARGEVYISDLHDYRSHVRGFIRIAKTKGWRVAKQTLTEIFKVIDDKKTSEEALRRANRFRMALAEVIEDETTHISEADGSLRHTKEAVEEFESRVMALAANFKKFQALEWQVTGSHEAI